jgi:hypothetical protein
MGGDQHNGVTGVQLLQRPSQRTQQERTRTTRAKPHLSPETTATPKLFVAFELGVGTMCLRCTPGAALLGAADAVESGRYRTGTDGAGHAAR